MKDKKVSKKTMAKAEKLLARVDELMSPVDTVRLKPTRGETTVFDSKLGGVPYFPKDMEYPKVREGEFCGRPLFFLGQLNFAELPGISNIPGFPTEGILQFFTGCVDDSVIGMDYKNGFSQNGFRVIYHENIITDKSALYSKENMPDFGEGHIRFPFKGEFKLVAEKTESMGISMCDFRAEKVVTAAYNELFNKNMDGIWDGDKCICDKDEELLDAICDTRNGSGTRMGGYPLFPNNDPRIFDDEYALCTVLLFQSDSECGAKKFSWDDMVSWGGYGAANFFISPESLAKRDFSHVLYHWDRG